jgi:hypothetical protein
MAEFRTGYVRTGRVKFFNCADNARYGFIRDSETGEEYFFHFNDGAIPVSTGVSVYLNTRVISARYPNKGDEIMFELSPSPRDSRLRARPWVFADHYRRESEKSNRATQKVSSRQYADPFDRSVDGPSNKCGDDSSSEAIGGCYGMGWDEYYFDALTGETYAVHCYDGTNRSKLPHTWEDEKYLDLCHDVMKDRFRAAGLQGATEIKISRRERIVMQKRTCRKLLETSDGARDGEDGGKEGLEGGLVGHFWGIPVICDLAYQDDLPERATSAA